MISAFSESSEGIVKLWLTTKLSVPTVLTSPSSSESDCGADAESLWFGTFWSLRFACPSFEEFSPEEPCSGLFSSTGPFSSEALPVFSPEEAGAAIGSTEGGAASSADSPQPARVVSTKARIRESAENFFNV